MDNISLIRIKNVVAYYYFSDKCLDNAVIYAKGGPSFGDSGESPLWKIAKRYRYSLLIPDYIGYCRSYGKFTFDNCLETIIECEKFLRGEISATDCLNEKEITSHKNNVILVGSSWGGAIVPFINRKTDTKIKIVGMIKPVTDWTTQGKTRYKEEKIEETNVLIAKGWENIYRGYSDSEWPKILEGIGRNFNPIDNVDELKNTFVHVFHGKQDKVVNWRKSAVYFNKLKSINPKGRYSLMLTQGDHGSQTNINGLRYILRRIKIIPQ